MMHRVLIVGVGSIGERHLRCFAATGRAEVALCEPNRDLASAIGAKYQFSQRYASVDDALRDWRPAVAVIAAPAHVHISIAMQLASAGVHLLIEKPLSTTLAGIDELKHVIHERGLTAATAYVLRADPPLNSMHEAIASGRFGRPVEMVAVSGSHFPTYRPAYRQIYYRDRATGGGAIQDALTHMINAAEWLMGPITRICVDAEHRVLEGVEVEDVAHALARHGSVLASYSLNQFQAPQENTITVICERATVRLELHAGRWSWMEKPDSEWQVGLSSVGERDRMFINQANAFLDAVEGKREPLCSLEEGLQTLKVNLAALKSLASGGWETVV